MAKKDEAPDYTDGTWHVPVGKSQYEKKPTEDKPKAKKKPSDEEEK